MRVLNEMDIYEVAGVKQELGSDRAKLAVRSHHIFTDRVELEFAGNKITVMARDLRNAVANAINHG